MNAYIDELSLITIPFHEVEGELIEMILMNTTTSEIVPLKRWEKKAERFRYELYLTEPIDFGFEYQIIANKHVTFEVKTGQVVRTKLFDEKYYCDDELGVIYKRDKTNFKLWAPTATEVQLVIYEKDNTKQVYPLKRCEKGLWQQSVLGDLDNYPYIYRVKVNGKWNEVVDPYASAVTVNGEKGVVIDILDTNPKGWEETKRPLLKKATDAIIYELHVRDFTIDEHSGVVHKGMYKGLIEKNTKSPINRKTGLDYLVDLGITHVQLLPIQDFGSIDEIKPFDAYNWGYDTVHFSAIEGSYSLNPFEPKERIKELKEVIQTFHENHLQVILDVVYNHVYIHHKSNLEKIVPGYYFRYHLDGSLSDGTGVGNDIASERKMVRKLIVDSVRYFAKEYRVDGFRFDLMGNLDIETMQQIVKSVTEINPAALILGEGWDLATALSRDKKTTIGNSDVISGISYFNDQFRDKLKGNIFHHESKGFCNGNGDFKEDLKMLVSGSTKDFYPIKGLFSDPYKSINYVECHDNHTLWDKLTFTNYEQPEKVRQQMHRLATAITILSQGIPFLHAGQEFFRTKHGVENSYCSPDSINKINWQQKDQFIDNVDYVKGLIDLRKNHSSFRLLTADEVKKHMYILDTLSSCLAYMLKSSDGMYVVAFNSGEERKEVILPANGIWDIYVEDDLASSKPLRSITGPKFIVSPLSTVVLFHYKTY